MFTIQGGSRRAKKSCKVLMMMKAAKLGRSWSREEAGLDQEQGQEGQKQGRSRAEVGTGQEKDRSKLGAGG